MSSSPSAGLRRSSRIQAQHPQPVAGEPSRSRDNSRIRPAMASLDEQRDNRAIGGVGPRPVQAVRNGIVDHGGGGDHDNNRDDNNESGIESDMDEGQEQPQLVLPVVLAPRRVNLAERTGNLIARFTEYYNETPALKLGSVILALFAIFLCTNSSSSSSSTDSKKVNGIGSSSRDIRARQEFFMNSTKRLFKTHFLSQELDTQLSLLAEGESVLGDFVARRQPSVITILVPPTVSDQFAACFVRKIGRYLNEAVNYYNNIKEVTLESIISAPDVTSIHEDLMKYLRKTGKAILFHDVDKLRQEAQLNILHAFCDNSQAPDKTATFFFLIRVPLHLYDDNDWYFSNGAGISYVVLDEAWAFLSRDKRPAIIARVTPTVILLRSGDTCYD